jgi:hypothetical protein
LIKVLAHNLFHKICEEEGSWKKSNWPDRGQAGLAHAMTFDFRQGWDYTSPGASHYSPANGTPAVCPNFRLAKVFSFEFKGLILTAGLLTLFSTVCVQSRPEMCVSRPA